MKAMDEGQAKVVGQNEQDGIELGEIQKFKCWLGGADLVWSNTYDKEVNIFDIPFLKMSQR